MTTIATAYDSIRLIRRKICIAEAELSNMPLGPQRDATVMQLTNLTRDLVRALHDFAAMGYEEDVADMLLPAVRTLGIVRNH
jgi:hypothetical protein